MNRRNFLAGVPAAFLGARELLSPSARALAGTKLPNVQKSKYTVDEKHQHLSGSLHLQQLLRVRHGQETSRASTPRTSRPRPGRSAWKAIAPSRASSRMEEILALAPLEERVYRHRCVEAWSIVVPWVGYSLSALLKQGRAHRQSATTWRSKPSTTASRCRHAAGPAVPLCGRAAAWTKPCTRWRCSASGMFGETLPPQDGAPVRIDRALEVRLQEHQVASSRSSWWAACRLPRGTSPTRTSTASTPT